MTIISALTSFVEPTSISDENIYVPVFNIGSLESETSVIRKAPLVTCRFVLFPEKDELSVCVATLLNCTKLVVGMATAEVKFADATFVLS